MRVAGSLRTIGPVFFCVLSVACGPSQEELDAEKARVRDLQGQLRQAEQSRLELEARLDAIRRQNGDLAGRLRALGENVEELEAGRASLETSLTETQRALDELRARERQAQERLATFRQMIERFRSMIEAGQLRVRVRGNRMVVELPEGILFDSGRAEIKEEGERTLTDVAGVLNGISNRDFQVAGHTDNVPIRNSRFPSNWELSTARAVVVARYLISQGVVSDRLSAAGYAETEPIATNDTREGRAQNRRIEIILVPNLDELPDLSSLNE
jgi:chemotaxis protein MotB